VKVAGHAEAKLAAPPERCLEVLTDFAAYPQWWPGCEAAEIVSGGPPAWEVAFRFDTHSPIGTIECRLRCTVSDDGTHLRLHALAGPLQRLEGEGWTLRRRADGHTDARYALAGEMRTGLPGFVERPFAAKAREVLIVEPVEALAQRIDALGA
jgi:ribosome-associated toxin RatA of RatAB toxin-antitoxin module